MSRPFQIYNPIGVWMDKSAPEGQQRRIGGLISTESRDRQDEVILQRGLDFSEFIQHGWFNDNHSKATPGAVGFPNKVEYYAKGTKLPDGNIAKTNGHWAEGYLLEGHKPADEIWSLAQSLAKAGGDRKLGFSIEGSVLRRSGRDRKTIAEAKVRNVAVTNCPVNTDTYMLSLAKSLREVDGECVEDLVRSVVQEEQEKALAAASASGAALQPESLDKEEHSTADVDTNKSFADAANFVAQRLPNAGPELIGRFLAQTILLKSKGLV